MQKKEALNRIFESALYYENNYVDKKLLLICGNNGATRITALEAVFRRSNFMHLTGVKFPTDSRMAPDSFYEAALHHHLKLNDFEMASDGTTSLKLEILPQILKSQSLSANLAGDYNFRKPVLVTDKLAGNIRGGMGFVFDSSYRCYVPNTVLNEDLRNNIRNQQRILLAYKKRIQDEKYQELVYHAKKFDFHKLVLPEGFEYLPMPCIDTHF